ncbi:protein SPA1-RELATED 2-like isoform X2 [Salvia splendens]|uniref:protein SPA1-RELATED 2-like isoform X2 n=1 Tax=Salvia splendens TaxID=180675 RepID=UPI001C26E9CD|nr:protein SPA1-RELATED 2-like isoform X2 [Salvia splendens]
MEEKQDDIAANESTEFSMRDSNIPTNPSNSNSNSNCPRSSTLTHFDSLNRGETFSTDVTPILRRSPYLRNDAGCSSSNEMINHDHKQGSQSIGWTGQNSRIIDEEFESRSKDSSKSCSRKELKRAFMSLQDVEFSPNKQMNMDSSISSDVIEGPNIRNMSSTSFTNLREWLESKGGVDASKNDKMLLFKRIVQVVNVSHVQGIALLELQPSSFILLDTGDVEYIGSTTETELWGVQDFSTGKRWLTYQNVQLEEKWYAFPEGFKTRDLLSLNVYSLGLLLFEFLCHFESIEAHTAAMADLHHRILPPSFLSRNHKEAGFCLWLLHPEPSSRPTTREILQSDLLSGLETARSPNNEEASCVEMVDDVEFDLLIHFLVKLKEEKLNKASSLLKTLDFLDSDVKMVERWRSYSAAKGQFESPSSSVYSMNMLKHKLLGNMKELESAYFSVRSSQLDNEMPHMTRSDSDVLRRRDHLSQDGTRHEEKHVERIGTFFDGVCKFARYDKFEVCGILRNDDILSSTNKVICSLCFDPEEEYLAVAGVSKKIKIFEFHSLLNDYVDVQYPLLEMSNKSKFTCICWNNHIRNHLASTDYDGEIWDASTGQRFGQYKEHNKRAWTIDFSHVDAKIFASGSDDCSLKIWSINQRNSTETIWNPANVCCVQFSPCSSHLVASGSADYRIYCYDLRHTRIPWCTLAGHDNAVSYVRFLDSETIVSASIDNTLKLWDLKATTLDGVSPPHASTLTFRGHTNDKNFVGLAVLDGYLACGSETNEVYAYYKSLPMPICCHKFGSIDPTLEEENIGHFVTSVCWRKKFQMIAAANSSGIVKILRLANSAVEREE